jgi:hypothetical protein
MASPGLNATILMGSGDGDRKFVFSATINGIAAVLDTATYTPDAHFNGYDVVE